MISSCYRHPDRETGIHCTRCGRSICPDCMVPAPVGHHCPTCVQEAKPDTARVRNVRWSFGQASQAGLMVKILVAINALVFILQQSDPTIVNRFVDAAPCVADGEFYRLLSSAFLHANISHIALNMLGLWIIGNSLEQVMGRVRFVVLYLIAGIGGSVAFNMFGGGGSALGASGAVFGLFGAALVIAYFRGGDTRTILMLIGINLLFGAIVPGIDNWGHLGGLATGLVIAAGFELSERWDGSTRLGVQVVTVLGTIVVLGLIVTTLTASSTIRDTFVCQLLTQGA